MSNDTVECCAPQGWKWYHSLKRKFDRLVYRLTRNKKNSGLYRHALTELKTIGMSPDSSDEMNRAMSEHILHMVAEFSKEGHSGFSASYALGILEKLLAYKPLAPLTGEDSEWMVVGMEENHSLLYQNLRCSHVFKNDQGAYDIDGKVFIEHWFDDDGEEHTSSYTNYESRVPVTFPYTPKTEFIDVGVRVQKEGE